MARPTKHPRTGVYRVRVAVPRQLGDEAARLYGSRWELIENLGTKDPKAAKAAFPAALARAKGKLAAIQAAFGGATASLNDRDVRSLGAEFYRAQLASIGDDPGDAAEWSFLQDALAEQVEQRGDDDRGDQWPARKPEITLTASDRQDAATLLAARGMPADPATVDRVGHAVFEAKWQFARLMERRADGDWSPNPWEAKQPVASATKHRSAPAVTFEALLDGFALDKGWGRQDAKPISRPLYDRQRTLARLADFIGHSDALKVTKADAVRWKEDMQRRGLKAATVRNDVSECSAVWHWAIRSAKLPDGTVNPFAGILPPKTTRRDREVRPFTDAEARMILLAAREQRGLLRWLPWVCCLTGARLQEVCQSNREDVALVDGVMALRIHDDGDGRSVKNADSRRTVPVHPALIAEGFIAYVAALPPGSPLFPDAKPDKVFGLRSTLAGKRVMRWLRLTLGIIDPRISPSHSWRHHFIDAARRVSMPAEVRSALTGHSGKIDQSAGYGVGVGSMLALMAEHLAKVPSPIPPP